MRPERTIAGGILEFATRIVSCLRTPLTYRFVKNWEQTAAPALQQLSFQLLTERRFSQSPIFYKRLGARFCALAVGVIALAGQQPQKSKPQTPRGHVLALPSGGTLRYATQGGGTLVEIRPP